MDAPTVGQPLASSQPTQYVSPPTQYVPRAQSPGADWASQQSNYSPPSAPTWAGPPVAQPVFAGPGPTAPSLPAARKRRRWPWYLLLFLVIFGVVVVGSWIFLLRPAIHQSVDGQIRQGLQQAIDQIPPVGRGLPPGVPISVTEGQINAYLQQNISQLAPITNMQVSLQPGVIVVNFQAYGFGSTVDLGLAAEGGTLVAQNVSVSGLLAWVESPDDLTVRFDDALNQVPGKLGRRISAVAIDTGVINFILA
jgi:hypothetical protein